jgi:hypothetical protein
MKRTNKEKATKPARDGSPVPRELVKATGSADIVALPRRRCLAIDGAGSPKDAAFAEAIGALYGTAYTLKFARKRAQQSDFKVGPMEGHWSADVPPGATRRPSADKWRWRLRIGVPAEVTKDDVDRIKRDVVSKKGGKLEGSPVVPHVFLESVPAQRVGRTLHVGPYSTEADSFERIDTTLNRAGLTPAPTHIEVYLNDPSRTRPDALRTVLLRELQR